MNTSSRFKGSPRGSLAGARKPVAADAATHRVVSERSVVISHSRRAWSSNEPQSLMATPRGRLVEPDLVRRLDGVREDLEASLSRGEITQEQLEKFLDRMEGRLLEEQGSNPNS